jgi:hypothetical protein
MRFIKDHKQVSHVVMVAALITALVAGSSRLRADTGDCGGSMITLPFTDVPSSNVFFCSIAEAYLSALTNGTDATHYSPSSNVPREQMAAFITRTMDQTLKRGSRRAALNQYWTTQGERNLSLTSLGTGATLVKSDGTDVWVGNSADDLVVRVQASDGKFLANYINATEAFGVLCALGKVFVTGRTSPGSLYQIDQSIPPSGSVLTLSNALGGFPEGIAFDGQRIWTANVGSTSASVSIISLSPTAVTTVLFNGSTDLHGIVFDGANMWVTEDISGAVDKLHRLDANGVILQTVDVGSNPKYPAFDGTNIWVPNVSSNTVTVVRAIGGLAGTVLATLSGNGLQSPTSAAFDGERILVTNHANSGSVSLWNATDLTPIGTFPTGGTTFPFGACSDGLNFWITLNIFGVSGRLARF